MSIYKINGKSINKFIYQNFVLNSNIKDMRTTQKTKKQAIKLFEEFCPSFDEDEYICCTDYIFFFTIGNVDYFFCKDHLNETLYKIKEKVDILSFLNIVFFLFPKYNGFNIHSFQKLLSFQSLICYNNVQELENGESIKILLNKMKNKYEELKKKFGRKKLPYLKIIYEPLPFLEDINSREKSVPKLLNLCKYKYTDFCGWNGILE